MALLKNWLLALFTIIIRLVIPILFELWLVCVHKNWNKWFIVSDYITFYCMMSFIVFNLLLRNLSWHQYMYCKHILLLLLLLCYNYVLNNFSKDLSYFDSISLLNLWLNQFILRKPFSQLKCLIDHHFCLC